MPDDPNPPRPSGEPEPRSHLEPGEWYWGVPCARCGEFLAFLHAPRGRDPAPAYSAARHAFIEIACWSCLWAARYPIPLLEKRHYQPSGEWGPAVARGEQAG